MPVEGTGLSRLVIKGTVPGCLPQTAPFAEACGMMAYQELTAVGTAQGYSDCQNVLTSLTLAPLDRLAPTSMTAGLAMQSLALRPFAADEVFKVKAHQSLDGLTGRSLWEATANSCADEQAKAARALHGGSPKAWELAQKELDGAELVAQFAARAAASWPQRPRCRLRPRSQATTAAKGKTPHRWLVRAGTGWRCQVCLKVAFTSGAKAAIDRRGCRGLLPAIAHLLSAVGGTGHELHIAMVEREPLLFCRLCSSWCTRRPLMLLRPCMGHPTAGQLTNGAWRLARGMAPNGSGAPICQPMAALPLLQGRPMSDLIEVYIKQLFDKDCLLVIAHPDSVDCLPGRSCLRLAPAGAVYRVPPEPRVRKKLKGGRLRLWPKTAYSETSYGPPAGEARTSSHRPGRRGLCTGAATSGAATAQAGPRVAPRVAPATRGAPEPATLEPVPAVAMPEGPGPTPTEDSTPTPGPAAPASAAVVALDAELAASARRRATPAPVSAMDRLEAVRQRILTRQAV